MPFVADRALDLGLNVFDIEANRLDICSSEPTTYSQATTAGTNSLGNKTLATGSNSPAAGSPNGRSVTIPSFSDGTVTTTGTASHWALTDTANSRLLATGSLAATQSVTSGNVFTLTSFTIRYPAAV